MKIRKFDNLWTVGLIISCVLLLGVYIIKLFCPEFYIDIAYSERICKIGHYIDNNKWAWYLTSFIMSFIAYYFYCCACCEKTRLNIKEVLIICITIVVVYFVREFLPKQYNAINFSSLIILPCLFKGEFKNTTICFTSLYLLQTITLEVRNLITLISDYNYASFIILMIDYYIAQILLYFYFNFKKEN